MLDFNFYENTLALSFANPSKKRTKKPKEMKSDFVMVGNPLYITNALIEQMERHPELAELITNAAYNFMIQNPNSKT